MLDNTQLHELLDTLDLPPPGRKLVLNARRQAPVREVQSRGGNVTTIMSSRKMSREIRTESRHLEFAAATHLEFDEDVYEYYPQPGKYDFDVIDEDGEIHRISHIPDLLSIQCDGIELIECKSEAKLQSLAHRFPWRFRRDSGGNWYAPLLEAHFAELGIRYRLWTERSLNPCRTANLSFLADYFHLDAKPCAPEALEVMQQVLREHGHVFVAELLAAPYQLKADDIYKAVADKLVVTDLDTQPLSKPNRCKLFRDQTLMGFVLSHIPNHLPAQERFDFELRPGNVLLYEGQTLTIHLVGEGEIVCDTNDSSTCTLTLQWVQHALETGKVQMQGMPSSTNFSQYSQAELQQALARQRQFEMQKPKVSKRTLRRWKQRQYAARANGGNEALALIPNTKQRGNTTTRLSEAQQDAINHIIQTSWRSHQAKNYKACHRELQLECSKLGISTPSYPTLIAAIKAASSNRTIRERHGKRMAYQQSTFVDVLYVDSPQHGSRPFEYVHIDHTQLDIELLSSRTDQPLGRPWLTLAIDAYSRRVLSLYLTFEPPSYTSVMMCIRAMVQRYKRLPDCVIVDNGKDLTSTAFATFLNVMGVHLRLRPAGQPRHGAVLERLFGRMHSEYVHNLSGNTKATKNVRMTTGKHLPKNFAEWTLETMHHGLQHWAFEYYDQEVHPTLSLSPRQAYERGLQQSGKRNHRFVAFNYDFMVATCPPVDRTGTRKVDKQRGVKVNDLLYWRSAFASPQVAGTLCPVRYDPWDASSVYAWVNNRWLRAQCRNLLELGHLTEAERQAFSEEYRSRNGKKVDEAVSTQRLKEFMQTFTPEGALAIALERQQENKRLYSQLELANVSPIELPHKPGLTKLSSSAKPVSSKTCDSEATPPPDKLKRTLRMTHKGFDAPEQDGLDELFDTF